MIIENDYSSQTVFKKPRRGVIIFVKSCHPFGIDTNILYYSIIFTSLRDLVIE